MTFSSAIHGTTCSISMRKTSRRVFFLLPAYSASEKLILEPGDKLRALGNFKILLIGGFATSRCHLDQVIFQFND
jgi:hypothetical protein